MSPEELPDPSVVKKMALSAAVTFGAPLVGGFFGPAGGAIGGLVGGVVGGMIRGDTGWSLVYDGVGGLLGGRIGTGLGKSFGRTREIEDIANNIRHSDNFYRLVYQGLGGMFGAMAPVAGQGLVRMLRDGKVPPTDAAGLPTISVGRGDA